MTPNDFRILPIVLDALKKPREPRSILNYMCACDTTNPETRESLNNEDCLLYTSPSPRDRQKSRMPSSA